MAIGYSKVLPVSLLPTTGGSFDILYYYTVDKSFYKYNGTNYDRIDTISNFLSFANKESFPIPGEASSVYYAADSNALYYYDFVENNYLPLDKEHDNCIIIPTKDDLPLIGEIGMLYYTEDTSKYYLCTEGSGWRIDSKQWTYVENESNLPTSISDGDNLIYIAKPWFSFSSNFPVGVEMVPNKVRFFTSNTTYEDIIPNSKVVFHTGIHTNKNKSPKLPPEEGNQYSVQTIIGISKEQAYADANLNYYNHVYIPGDGTDYFCINDDETVYDYQYLINKPSINNVILSGNVTLESLGIAPAIVEDLPTTDKTLAGAIREIYATFSSCCEQVQQELAELKKAVEDSKLSIYATKDDFPNEGKTGYTYLAADIGRLFLYNATDKKYEEVYTEKLPHFEVYTSSAEFPDVGQKDTTYIASDIGHIYIYNETDNLYEDVYNSSSYKPTPLRIYDNVTKFPFIGDSGITYIAADTGHNYIYDTIINDYVDAYDGINCEPTAIKVYPSSSAFPSPGEENVTYIASNTGHIYIYDISANTYKDVYQP